MKRQTFTILVAEDDANDQALIAMAFEKANPKIHIQLVISGQEAIAYLEGRGAFADRSRYEYPSFIITDLKMPNGDGFSVLESLKSKPAFVVIPTVVLSGSADLDDIQRSYILGASAYLVKPQALQDLERLLKLLLDFWMACEVPQVDPAGKRLQTESRGKLGERFRRRTARTGSA